MKLRIIKWKFVQDHCKNDRRMKNAFNRFYEISKNSDWSKPQDIFETFADADLVTCQKSKTTRIVFNVGANKYRLVVGYYFAPNQTFLYLKFIGTHKEYDRIDVCEVDMFKQKK